MKQAFFWVPIALLVLNGCDSSESTPSQELNLSFQTLPPPFTEAAQYQVRATDRVWVNGQSQAIGYQRLIQVGQEDNGEIYGAMKDAKNQPILSPDGSPYLCHGTDSGQGSGLDHISILQKNERLYLVSQFECAPGAMYLNELQQSSDGALSLKKGTLQYISQTGDFGGWVHCAGVTTPWQSHLGSEEYEPDANPDGPYPFTENAYFQEVSQVFWSSASQNNPYYYGWTPEVSVDESGDPQYVKHYAMGRFAHELAYVMPDEKTVYLSDDGAGGALFLFVADKARDLSAGRLYAAKWQQTSAQGLGEAVLSWVDMGHSSNQAIKSLLQRQPTFADIFTTATMSAKGQCPAQGSGLDGKSYAAVNTAGGVAECLQLKDVNLDGQLDQQDVALASRLESRRMAGVLGATTEFDKMEGISFNARDQRLYLSISQVRQGMEDFARKGEVNKRYDLGGRNDIRLGYNPCGGVYQLSVAQDAQMGSDYVAYQMRGLLAGQPKAYAGTVLADNQCDLDQIANPDNLAFLADSNTLVIGEDTSFHFNDVIWAYDLEKRHLQRLVTTPYGSEATSPFWYQNINGFGYLTLVSQHPFGEVVKGYQRPKGVEARTEAGFLGPFKFH